MAFYSPGMVPVVIGSAVYFMTSSFSESVMAGTGTGGVFCSAEKNH